MKTVIIVGGGSAGWMTASTLVKNFPELNISLIESPNIPISGVGESTIAGINEWMSLIGVEDKDFMKATDATYKLSIRFNNFYKKGEGFHYPFSFPYTADTTLGANDWHIKKMVYPETPNSDYADSFYSIMALVNQNKFDKNLDYRLPYFTYGQSTAYHFDATKFGIWLRDNICLPGGVRHIKGEVVNVTTDEDGIQGISLDTGMTYMADLFIDCTGFKSLLLDKSVKEPFESFTHMLPNNRAWATRIPYGNKKEELVTYTDSTALGNGWVWRIPLWSRMGTGYVYSDKHINPDNALIEFKEHLKEKHPTLDPESLEYKDLIMRVGIHERTWVKNCVAIGLSAGFIEPLESNGLYTVHKFLVELCRTLLRSRSEKGLIVSQYDKTIYNTTTKKLFKEFATFVAMHYALTRRQDTQYWRDCMDREYDLDPLNENLSMIYGFRNFGIDRMIAREFHLAGGFPCIASGMGYNAVDEIVLKTNTLFTGPGGDPLTMEDCKKIADKLSRNPKRWAESVKNCLSHHDYLETHIYREDNNG